MRPFLSDDCERIPQAVVDSGLLTDTGEDWKLDTCVHFSTFSPVSINKSGLFSDEDK